MKDTARRHASWVVGTTTAAAALAGLGLAASVAIAKANPSVLASPTRLPADSGTPAPTTASLTGQPPAVAPTYVKSLQPTGIGALVDPFGVAVTASGAIWVTSRGSNRVEKLTPTGTVVISIGAGLLEHPEGIGVAPSGNLWVADTGHDRVLELSPQGALLDTIDRSNAGSGLFVDPTAVAVSGSGQVFVANQGTNRVEEFSSTGAYIATLRAISPDGVAVNSSGDVWTAAGDRFGNFVNEFSRSGKTLVSIDSTQATYGGLSNPAGVAVDGNKILVAQPDFGWITVLNAHGAFNTEFGLQTSAALGFENLSFPEGVAVAPDGRIYVADSGNNRIVVYAPPSDWAPDSTVINRKAGK